MHPSTTNPTNMRRIAILSILGFLTLSASAQSDKYIGTMEQTISNIGQAETVEQMMALSNKFERIALAEKSEWLPYYYASFTRCLAGYMMQDKSGVDAMMDVAQTHIDLADSLEPGNSEISLLKAMVLTGRMMVDPMSRGMQYGMQSSMLNQTAISQDPGNPRAYYLMGQGLFYTPPEFGGGQDKGCAMIAQALEHYATFEPASSIHPDWGQKQAEEIYANCPQASGNESMEQEEDMEEGGEEE